MDDSSGTPTSTPSKKRTHSSSQAKNLSSVITIGDTEIQEPNWCTQVLSSLLNDPSTHDVTFKTSDGGNVSAHRVIVAAGSPVLRQILLTDKNSQQVVSVDTMAFSSLMTYFYTGKVTVNSSNFDKILAAAKFFKVTSLEANLISCIASSLDVNTVLPVAIIASDKNWSQLLEHCLKILCANANNIIRNPNFTKLPEKIVLDFCKSSELNVSEIDLFLAVMEWQKQNKKVTKAAAKNVLREIRYPLISSIDLVTKVASTGLVDQNLYTAALEYHVVSADYKGPPSQLRKRKHQLPTELPSHNVSEAESSTVPQNMATEPAASSNTTQSSVTRPTKVTATSSPVMKTSQAKSKSKPATTQPVAAIRPAVQNAVTGRPTTQSIITTSQSVTQTTITSRPAAAQTIGTSKSATQNSVTSRPVTQSIVTSKPVTPVNATHKPGTSVVTQNTTNRPAQYTAVTMPGRSLVYTTPVPHSVAATSSGLQQASVATINPAVAMSLVYNQTVMNAVGATAHGHFSANKGTHSLVATSPQGIQCVTGSSTVLPKNATTPVMSYVGTSSPGRNRKRCNACEGCRASSCGTCLNCAQNDPKKICVNRICQAPQ